ncbi:MAG: tetratricopeptide repeat protein, partial [Candidatus Eisenbacteria sp.]|nr:tetratricopeptide repeat protein [Candidatus Eisenbacteria bacterium]
WAQSGYGLFLGYLGRAAEASAHMRRALELDPDNPVLKEVTISVLLAQREFEKAASEAQAMIKGSPADHDGYALAGQAWIELSRYEEAIEALTRSKETLPAHEPQGHKDTGFCSYIDTMLGIAYARQGNTDSGEEVLHRLTELRERGAVSCVLLASLCFALEKRDEGFAWLQKACKRRERDVLYLRTFPWFDDVRSDPRFEEILRIVGFPD